MAINKHGVVKTIKVVRCRHLQICWAHSFWAYRRSAPAAVIHQDTGLRQQPSRCATVPSDTGKVSTSAAVKSHPYFVVGCSVSLATWN